eukprot:195589-Rhodomonas_salina.1
MSASEIGHSTRSVPERPGCYGTALQQWDGMGHEGTRGPRVLREQEVPGRSSVLRGQEKYAATESVVLAAYPCGIRTKWGA